MSVSVQVTQKVSKLYGIVIVSRMFQGHLYGVSTNVIGVEGCFKGYVKGFSWVFHNVTREYQGVSNALQGCLKGFRRV